jgi:hypothetical protein
MPPLQGTSEGCLVASLDGRVCVYKFDSNSMPASLCTDAINATTPLDSYTFLHKSDLSSPSADAKLFGARRLAINSVVYNNPGLEPNSILTAGSDGVVRAWNLKQKIKSVEANSLGVSITSLTVPSRPAGPYKMYACAASYDFSQGPDPPSQITPAVHVCSASIP